MSASTSVLPSTRTETEYFSFLLQYAFQNQFAVAAWKLPASTSWQLLLSRQHQLIHRDAPLEELPAGFIFAPFERSKDSVFLQADHIFTFAGGQLKSPSNSEEIASSTWLEEVMKSAQPAQHKITPYHAVHTQHHHDAHAFEDTIRRGIELMESKTLEKVVLSRTKQITLSPEFDIVETFHALCQTYPHAFISFVSSPLTGSWLGASPETLVAVEDKSIFKTVALAGTKKYQEGTDLKMVAWTQKEIEEQALVERYIISCFKKIRVREYDEHGPKTVVAGNLMHLRSDFTVDMKEINFPQLGSVMLQLLHPTSAVCGMPLDPALDFIKKYEGYDREYYAGFLGPINVDNNIHVAVNLRCMKLLENSAVLYAGAGITQDSVPSHEWNETELKFNTLLNVINHQ